MIIDLRESIWVHHAAFGRRVDAQSGALIDFEGYGTIRCSTDFPREALQQLAFARSSSGIDDIEALIPDRLRDAGALLMRPISYRAQRSGHCHAMALHRFRRSREPASRSRSRSFLEIHSAVVEQDDWSRHAVTLLRRYAPSFGAEPTADGADARDSLALPRRRIALSRPRSLRLRDCPAPCFAALDALRAGRRAVFGRESFGDETAFLDVCAALAALLPPALRHDLSIAAGFTEPIPEALLQWIDAVVDPPRPSTIAARFADFPGTIRAAEASTRVFGGVSDPDPADGPVPRSSFETAARNRVAALLTRRLGPGASPHADANQAPPFRLEPAGSESAVAIVDALGAIENVLEVARAPVDRGSTGDARETVVRAAIAHLRTVLICKSRDDVKTNACALMMLAESPHSFGIVSALIESGDRELRTSIENALYATALLPASFDDTRRRIICQLLAENTRRPGVVLTVRGFGSALTAAGPQGRTRPNRSAS